jgi:uncharacterized caspase-like protein
MKRWGTVIGLSLFLLAAGCTLHNNVPVADIKADPPHVKKIPLNVAILIPEQIENYTFNNQHRIGGYNIETTYPLGRLLKKASSEIFPYVFDQAILIKGEPYPPDIDAVIIPTLGEFSPHYNNVYPRSFTARISLKVVLIGPQGRSLWDGIFTSPEINKIFYGAWDNIITIAEKLIPIKADATYETISEALKEAAVQMAGSREIKEYAASLGKGEPILTTSRPSSGPVKPLSATNTKVWLLSVGISKYRNPEMNLQFADKDARAIHEFMTNPKGGLVNREYNSKLLLNEQATRVNMVMALEHILKQAFDEDLVVLYFAMHGMVDPDGSELFFIASDTDPRTLSATGVSQLEIERAVSKSKAGKVLMIVDTCHSGSAGLSGMFAQRAISTAAVSNRLLNKIAIVKKGISIFTASSSTEFSQENITWGGGHGVFTHYLVEGLKGKADENKDGFVTLRELYDYTYRRVKEETQSNQHPEIKGTLDTNIPLAEVR